MIGFSVFHIPLHSPLLQKKFARPVGVSASWRVPKGGVLSYSENGNPSKTNLEKVACFSSQKNDRQLTSVSPAIHHKFTIKKPRSAHRFCENP
jgi:hypothetical protein